MQYFSKCEVSTFEFLETRNQKRILGMVNS